MSIRMYRYNFYGIAVATSFHTINLLFWENLYDSLKIPEGQGYKYRNYSDKNESNLWESSNFTSNLNIDLTFVLRMITQAVPSKLPSSILVTVNISRPKEGGNNSVEVTCFVNTVLLELVSKHFAALRHWVFVCHIEQHI